MCLFYINFSGVTVGLELSSYTVSESYGEVEICINAVGANPSCPNIQPFQVSLTANDESASVYIIILVHFSYLVES